MKKREQRMCHRVTRVVTPKKKGKCYMEQILQIRDKMVLYILAGLGVCRSIDLSYLAGFNNASYLRRRLSILKKQGLIATDYLGREKIYFLTSKGYLQTERTKNSYTINSQTIHDVGVARICTYLYLTQKVAYADFITDRQLFYSMVNSGVHRPDIVLGRNCYEYERTIKNYRYIKENIRQNLKYDKQVWVVHSDSRLLKKIPQLAEECFIDNLELITYEDIDKYVRNADLTQNVLRSTACLGERNFSIWLQKQTTNKEFDSYFNNNVEERYYD